MLSGLFGRGADVEVRDAASLAWGDWGGGGYSTASGLPVNVDTASQLLAVYGSVRLIADSISTLPLDCFQRAPDGTREELPAPRWLQQPTPYLNFVDWCGQVLWSLLMTGNAYVSVGRMGTGIEALTPLDPTHVAVDRQGGRKVYLVGGALFPGEIMHIKGLMRPGSDVGLSPLEAARQSIGLGLSALEYGAGLFDRDANMPGVIEMPGRMQPDSVKAMAAEWSRRRSRKNRGMPGVLVEGATWKPTGVTPEQGQFLETRQWTAAEIVGQVFLIDPSDLGIPVPGTSLTYANLTDRNTRRVQVTLRPWMERIEDALSALLSAPRYVRFNAEGLLRGNPSERFSLYETASRINTAAAAIGEAPLMPTAQMRTLEDWPPLPEPAAKEDHGRSLSIAETVQKVYLGVGTVLTSDEAREVVNAAGADLPIPGPPLRPASPSAA